MSPAAALAGLGRRSLRAVLPEGVDRRGISVLSTGHLAADLFQGSVPALLPFLIRERGYSYAAAGALFLMGSLGSSLVQPVLGIYADRVRASWLMPLGLALAAGGLTVAGVAASYPATAVALLVGGFGVAAFHPEAVRFATHVSARRRGTGMSVFAVGGAAGFALGPILTTPLVLWLGLPGTGVVGLVILLAGAVVLVSIPHLERFRVVGERHLTAAAGVVDRWGRFSLAAATGTTRAALAFGLQAFVPSYAIAELATSEGVGNAAVATMLAASAAGTLLGGRLADRLGFRVTVLASLVLQVPLAAALPLVPLPGVFAVMGAIGLVGGMCFYPLVAIGQNAIPRHLGLAAGVMLGLAIGVGAGIVALLGVLGDHAGLTAVLWTIAGIAALGVALGLTLPRDP
ncbi:MAG: MFS transporter [Thermoleophilia bacterium]